MTKHKKVLVIGASGMVGMATIDALQKFTDNALDTVTYNSFHIGKASLDEAFHHAQKLCGLDQVPRPLR